MKGITACVLVLVFFVSFVTVTATGDTTYGNIWQMIRNWFRSARDIEIKCRENEVPFSGTKMETELEICLRPHLKELMKSMMSLDGRGRQNNQIGVILHEIYSGRTVEAEHINLLRQRMVKPFCRFVPSFFNCVEPRGKELIESCTTNGGYETLVLTYVDLFTKSACKDKGTLLVDYIVAEGMACGEFLTKEGDVCFQNFINDDFPRLQKTTQGRCDKLGKLHDCVTLGLNACPKKKAVNILQSMLGDLKSWISTECHINATSPGKRVSNSVLSVCLGTMFYLLLK